MNGEPFIACKKYSDIANDVPLMFFFAEFRANRSKVVA